MPSPFPFPTTGVEVAARARWATHRGCRYKLGAGGRLWHRDTPWTPLLMTCDCSGFAAWCLGVDRLIKHPRYAPYFGQWLETTAILLDARDPAHGFFQEQPWELARPGDLLVWGDRDGRQGHVGVVVDATPVGPYRVVHCSTGNYRTTGDAIGETAVGIFLNNRAAVARYSELA